MSLKQKKISGKMCEWLCKASLFGMFFLFASYSYSEELAGVYADYSYSEELADVSVDISQPVIYCSISSDIGANHLTRALKEGSVMAYRWEIIIEEVRSYWLNKNVGNVQFSRQVVPDLVSKQWLLKDSNSGITSATLSTRKAVSFLARLKHFPVIDRSLLESGVNYTIRVKLYVEEGEVKAHWWDLVTKFGDTVAVGSFTLP